MVLTKSTLWIVRCKAVYICAAFKQNPYEGILIGGMLCEHEVQMSWCFPFSIFSDKAAFFFLGIGWHLNFSKVMSTFIHAFIAPWFYFSWDILHFLSLKVCLTHSNWRGHHCFKENRLACWEQLFSSKYELFSIFSMSLCVLCKLLESLV